MRLLLRLLSRRLWLAWPRPQSLSNILGRLRTLDMYGQADITAGTEAAMSGSPAVTLSHPARMRNGYQPTGLSAAVDGSSSKAIGGKSKQRGKNHCP